MTIRSCPSRSGHFLYLLTLLLLGLLALPLEGAAQGRRTGGRSGRSSDPELPAQRVPLPRSEVDLASIPYRLVFESYRETAGRNNWEICIVAADGSGLVNLTNTPEADEFYPHASPDGTKICFVADVGSDRATMSRNVYCMDIDGSDRVLVAENARQPCWSPDGRRIAYLKGEYRRYNSNSWSNRGLAVFDLATGRTTDHPNRDIALVFNLCWSPDGEWFTATSRGRPGGNLAFGVDDQTRLTLDLRGCRPDISPDGWMIAWGRSDWDLDIGRFEPDADGPNVTEQRAVIACERDYKVYHVDWSPDGRYLAFSYGSSRGNQAVGRQAPGWNICVYELATDRWVQVTSDGRHYKEPDWVPVEPGR